MRPMRFSFAIAAALFAANALAQGPMSSSKPPETPAAPNAGASDFDVNKLFANTCGWCHSDGGRVAGKGPQLMGTTLTDAEIIHRIKVGKPGAMPAFGSQFSDGELQAIVRYIRALK
jgi:mono/diheme cytochrome c family protein